MLDAEVGRKAGAYLARHAWPRGVRVADALIAAAATTSGLRLWTLNQRHYPMEDVVFYEPAGRVVDGVGRTSVQREVDEYREVDINGLAVQERRLVAPLGSCLDGGLYEA